MLCQSCLYEITGSFMLLHFHHVLTACIWKGLL
jgi:hypothetical protein